MKVWITARALALGIEEYEAEYSGMEDGVRFKRPGDYYATYVWGRNKHWHETRESAIARAEEIRLKKIVSMRKQLAVLETKRFE
jgi:hypothetical protein